MSRPIPVPSYQCHNSQRLAQLFPAPYSSHNQTHKSATNVHVDSKVLVFVETQYSSLGRQIVEVLEASRIKFKVEISGKSLPVLTNMEKGKFAVIVFENFDKYIQMNKWNRELLDKYCTEFAVGVIGFMPRSKDDNEVRTGVQMRGFPLSFNTRHQVTKYILNPQSPVLRIAKAGVITQDLPVNLKSTVFRFNHSTYLPLAEVVVSNHQKNKSLSDSAQYNSSSENDEKVTAVVQVGNNLQIDACISLFLTEKCCELWISNYHVFEFRTLARLMASDASFSAVDLKCGFIR